ncbi:MAG: paraquat-inducible protein A [Streptosporangiaceae bacterium]
MSYQPPFDGDWMRGLPVWTEYSRPRSVQNAVKCMYAGAATDILAVIVGFARFSNLKSEAEATVSGTVTTLTPTQVNQVANIGVALAILLPGLLGIVVWLWMANKNNAGKRWARVLSTLLFSLGTLGMLAVIVEPMPSGTWMIAGLKILPLATWLAGLCAIVLLWQRDSTEFFRSQSSRY